MIITYFRSSSFNAHNMCEQLYFFDYVLGFRSPSNKKADKGTIVHKVLEILAYVKYNAQKGLSIVTDEIVGEIDIHNYNLDNIIDIVYNHYSNAFSHHEWSARDLKDCREWTYKAINYGNGMFDPRNRTVLCPEQQFDIQIDKPWSDYEYTIEDKKITGKLAIKGTIDLITQINEDTLEIIDWKTGKRLDWATGQEKTQAKLEQDPQLMIYFYAVKHLYPNIKNCIVTIFFINDGGPFSISFTDKDLISTENILREKFNKIRKCKKPSLSRSWKCNKLCHYGKTTFENSHIEPLLEYRNGQVCNQGNFMTKCEQVKHDIELYGIKGVVDKYTMPGYNVGYYKPPGSAE